MSDVIARYKEELVRQLRWVSPAELPGIMSVASRYDRKKLFFRVKLGDGIEAFRRIGVGQNNQEPPEKEKNTSGPASAVRPSDKPSLAEVMEGIRRLDMIHRTQLRKSCQMQQRDEICGREILLAEQGHKKDTLSRENLEIRSYQSEKSALFLNDYMSEMSKIDNKRNIRIRPDISSQLMARYQTQNWEKGLFTADTKIVFLFAAAGGGKSFFLQRLVLSCMDTEEKDRDFLQTYGIPDAESGPLLPLRMTCRGYHAAQKVKSSLLAEFNRLTGEGLPDSFDRSRLLLVIDGMDEIDDQIRGEFYDTVIRLCQEWDCRVIFSMRPTWVLDESRLAKAEGCYRSICICPLDEQQILGDPVSGCEGFALQWFHVIYPKADQERFAARLHQILCRNYEYIRNLMDTPLMTINILCLLMANTGISSDRGYVLQKLFELQLRWKIPYEKCDKTPYDRLLILSYIAYHISVHQTSDFSLPEEKVIRLWQTCNSQFTMLDQDAPLTPVQIKDTLEDFISSQSLLLWLTDRNGKFSLAFSHRQYLEFLTAFAIVNAYLPAEERNLSIVALLRPHFDDSMWQDIILYCLFLMHRSQDGYREGLLHCALIQEWQPQYPLGGFGLLLSNHIPMTREQRGKWIERILPFDRSAAESLVELLKNGENELLEELRFSMVEQGSSCRIPAGFLRLYENRENIDRFLKKQQNNLLSGRNTELSAWNLYMIAWLRVQFSENWLQTNFPSMGKSDVALPTECLEMMVSLTERNILPLHTLGLMRQAGMIRAEEMDGVFSKTHFQFCFDYIEKNWKKRQYIQPCFEAFAGFPITVHTLSMTCPAAERMQSPLAALGAKMEMVGDNTICGLTAAMLSQPLNIRETLHLPACQYLERVRTGELQALCCYPGQGAAAKRELSNLREHFIECQLADERLFADVLHGSGLKVAVNICRYIRENGGPGAAADSIEISDRCTNLAYLARTDPRAELLCYRCGYTVEKLLGDGVRRGRGCAVVNECLMRLERCKTMTKESRNLLGRLDREEWNRVLNWWKLLAERNDPEGLLVCCWAAEYGEIKEKLLHQAEIVRYLRLLYGARGIDIGLRINKM